MNLIVQGKDIPTPSLKQLAKLSGADAIEAVSLTAFRLQKANESTRAEVTAWCEANALDCGWVPAGRRIGDFGLLVMDMDSTLITIECIDEIADMQGLKPQVSAITESAMRGEIDFAESLRRRVALLAGLDESALQRVFDERLQLSPGAETLLAAARAAGMRTLLVSGGFTFFTERLKTRLGLDYTAANTLEIIDGKLSGRVLGEIVDAQAKADWLNQVRTALELRREQVIAVGDGANDLKMMAEAGVSIAYHAKPVVRAQASQALNQVGLDGVIPLLGGA
ncbi:MAG TPA: phosphoserine phosphatase SerB [Thiobacillus sp.]|nr:MAG: phosphoserine phosphatase SerB [Hydrogenophilales bacterium 28-61-11]OYZ57138.1 MAG: phosphoserine phosphatase SerB [Hydrogenophilales bacterium 16-61-112]OZA47317.1 MAG: phosphoserine phosphatase SerB [Hydrogenophilales bacterium 17-61-76]HQT31200.1 phosphoserine phosphatase SerB [Thiobacillus sp.]HQT71096.1 phosphoserine phosphatase SerB [Thiobacillus sp.]